MIRRWRAFGLSAVLWLGLPTGAHAQPYTPIPTTKPLTPAEKATIKAAIKEARALGNKNAHAHAATAWERVFALQPSRVQALVEAGYEALRAGELPRAEQLTKRALSYALRAKQRGAAEYNLGLLAEKRADKPAAIAAYLRSLDARHTRTVREALAKLDPAAAQAADPVRPKPLSGPFPTLEAFCATQTEHSGACPSDLGAFTEDEARLTKSGPWREARVFGDADGEMCSVGLRTQRGWFVLADAFYCVERGYLEQKVGELTFRQLQPGGAPELVLRVHDEWSGKEDVELGLEDGTTTTGRAMTVTSCEEHSLICGLGPDATPSCFQVETAFADHEACAGDQTPWLWRLLFDWKTSGQIDVTASGKPTSDVKSLTGKRPFAF